jgi:hypothetical protein
LGGGRRGGERENKCTTVLTTGDWKLELLWEENLGILCTIWQRVYKFETISKYR